MKEYKRVEDSVMQLALHYVKGKIPEGSIKVSFFGNVAVEDGYVSIWEEAVKKAEKKLDEAAQKMTDEQKRQESTKKRIEANTKNGEIA